MIHTIEIPNWRPHSCNSLMGKHHMETHRMKNSDMQMIGAYASRGNTPKATKKRKVEIIIGIVKGRQPDPDAYHKSTHDALKRLGLIVDDSSKYIELTPCRFIRGKDKFTRIILEDL